MHTIILLRALYHDTLTFAHKFLLVRAQIILYLIYSSIGLFYLAPQGAPKFPRTPLPYIVIAKGIISTYQF